MFLKKRRRRDGSSTTDIARHMIARADSARDAARWHEAGAFYAEAVRLVPERADLRVQAGHMFKEAGDHAAAETHYLASMEMLAEDADLALQLGHFYKNTGRPTQAAEAYRRARALAPDWQPPQQELRRLEEAGWQTTPSTEEVTPWAPATSSFLPDLVPKPASASLIDHPEVIELRRLGRKERTAWGILPTLRGVEALRGVCISARPILEIQVHLNRQLVYRGPVRGGYMLAHERSNAALRKYVFNIWYDFSRYAPGQYELEYRLIGSKAPAQSCIRQIAIAEPLDQAVHATSDGVVALAPDDARTVEQQVRGQRSMIRDGRRAMLAAEPRTILVQRVDQLGDVVVSIPALKRLRSMFPDAKIVGLVSSANSDLVATLGLFDEIVTVDFPDDPWEQRRIMTADVQDALRRRLTRYGFDMAIDLSENASSRLLLLLSGAPVLVGFRSDRVPSLTVEIEGNTHDRWDGHEIVPHTNKLLGLVEWLAAMIRSETNIMPRNDLSRDRLAAFGVLEKEQFVVLHDGARLKFSRWPHYARLAELILAETDLRIVMLTDDPTLHESMPETLTRSRRFVLIDRRLAFDDFDALLSFASVFVGNDSGPKHVASLRGTNVVSIHMARNNWNEWGQENGGLIVSRKVPCAGCLVWHDPEECGKDFACIVDIQPEEVLRAVLKLL